MEGWGWSASETGQERRQKQNQFFSLFQYSMKRLSEDLHVSPLPFGRQDPSFLYGFRRLE